jgi:predicted NBD/HSP70 family sugar kinase
MADRVRRGAVQQGTLRAHNLSEVLRAVVEAPHPPTRARIATTLGVTRATASDLVDRLIESGLVVELEQESLGRAGRPGTLLGPGTHAVLGLGLEVQVDHLAVRATDLTGAAVAEAHRPGDYRASDPRQVALQLARLAAPIVEGLDGGPPARGTGSVAPAGPVAGACVSVPALLDRGLVRLAPNLGWRDVDLAALLAADDALSGIDVRVGNDADLSARAEVHARAHREGTPRSAQSFLYVAGEVGIGGAIVVDGEVSAGRGGWSGEIGHAVIDRAGPRCACGATGCLETFAGRDAIADAAGVPRDVPVAELAAAASTGARRNRVRRALDTAAEALGVAVATALNLVDVEHVVLGGVYGALFEHLEAGIREQIAARVLAARWTEVAVSRALAGPDAGVTGAGLRVLDDVVRDPSRWMAAPSATRPRA